ncbi:MAG: hypothetical protein OES26_24640 [Gammaproteobacteria bacterium]|nr:hypothetical protein [Gammaproteobacteria bacterium]
MTQHAWKQAGEPPASEETSHGGAMSMCPMARMCGGMMKKRSSGWLLMLPGILLIILGVLIFVEPQILVWFIAAATILMGIMLLMMAGFIRRMGA